MSGPSSEAAPAAEREPSTATNGALLKLTNVNTYYGRIHALQGVDLEVARGEWSR